MLNVLGTHAWKLFNLSKAWKKSPDTFIECTGFFNVREEGSMKIIAPWTSLCVVFVSLGMYFLSGCEGAKSPIPKIISLNPTSGPIATPTTVTIVGSNFGSTRGTNSVTFGGITLTPSTWSDTSITVTVSQCGLPPG